MGVSQAFRQISSVVLIASFAITGCTKNKPSSDAGQPTADIFSNREIISVPDLYLVTLNEPALLTFGNPQDPDWAPPEEAKNKLIAEQNTLEQKLKVISPDITILFRYRLVLNALAVYAPSEIIDAVTSLPQVKSVTSARKMARPQAVGQGVLQNLESKVNSVNFMGSDRAHRLGFRGEGIRVAVLDSGVDFTHAMLGGAGDKAVYDATDPNLPSSAFPNAKVSGGIDLVGSAFNSGSSVAADRLPRPDANPIDEMGHGTHVAGTIAGIGDGVNTYSGVAPAAQIYAVKVFGKDGSTMDTVVIAALEYSLDPNNDLKLDDRAQVVNLSLGGAFGTPQIRYVEAIQNVSRAGTLVVAAAGNNGAVDYVVGAPGTSDDALSVAAIVDGSDSNWRFPAVSYTSPTGETTLARFTEATFTKKLSDASAAEGELYYIGLADQELTEEQKAGLQGKIALIQRGTVNFQVKVDRAFQGGAIGAVVFNNAPGDLITMSGEVPVDIPAVMIAQEHGLKILEDMKAGAVRVNLKNMRTIDEPERIDQMAEFSSKGPRSEDNLIKPEISAPGYNITSAAMGQGNLGTFMDGTSMATPHMAGAAALIRQAHPGITTNELKSLAMNTSRVLLDQAGKALPIASQGAGRIQVDRAVEAPVAAYPFAFSLGHVQVETSQTIAKTLKLKNLTARPVTLTTGVEAASGLKIEIQGQVEIPANGEIEIPVRFDVVMEPTNQPFVALDGRVFFRRGSETVLQIPAMAVRTDASAVLAAPGADGEYKLTNHSPNAALVLAFNLLGEDRRKVEPGVSEAWLSRRCDLKSVGYRIRHVQTENGPRDYAEFAFKLYQPVTQWEMCDVSVLVDSDEDGIADQELAGSNAASLEGIEGLPYRYGSLLLDANRARAIRLEYEQKIAAGEAEPTLDYLPALIEANPMLAVENSTLAIVLAPVDALAKTADGRLNVKFAVSANSQTFEFDDFLGQDVGDWYKIGGEYAQQPHYIADEYTLVEGNGSESLKVEKGVGQGSLVLYYPINQKSGIGHEDVDSQQQIFP